MASTWNRFKTIASLSYVFMAKPAMSVLSHLGTFAGKRCCTAQNHDIQEQIV
ncbi:hypothetical protein D083_2197 [Dickeya solani RNS 08.23.3.1.A]|nr:hypothetical protein D083_2197 [Dickeya solani RNS 08.23.3.1.A]